MKRTEIPGTGLSVPPVALGTWGLGGPYEVGGQALGWPATDEAQARSVIHAALDAGLSFIDTADFYGGGRSEEIIGRALGARRADAVIASKWGLISRLNDRGDVERAFSVVHLTDALNASLRRLRTDYIDVYQLHGPPLAVLNQDDLWLALEGFKRSGKIRSVGVSLRSSDAGDPNSLWWRHPGIDVWQAPYSPVARREVEGVDQGAQTRPASSFVLARSVLHHGLLVTPRRGYELREDDHRRAKASDTLFEKVRRFWSLAMPEAGQKYRIQALLAFALGGGTVSSSVIGATSPAQIEDLAEAIRDGDVFDAEWSRDLRAVAAEVF